MMQMVMVDRNDDDNSHNDDGVDGNAVYDSKGGDEADNSNDQTESIAVILLNIMEVPNWKCSSNKTKE